METYAEYLGATAGTTAETTAGATETAETPETGTAGGTEGAPETGGAKKRRKDTKERGKQLDDWEGGQDNAETIDAAALMTPIAVQKFNKKTLVNFFKRQSITMGAVASVVLNEAETLTIAEARAVLKEYGERNAQ